MTDQEHFLYYLKNNIMLPPEVLKMHNMNQRVYLHFAGKLCKNSKLKNKYFESCKSIYTKLGIRERRWYEILNNLKHLFYRSGKKGQRKRLWMLQPNIVAILEDKEIPQEIPKVEIPKVEKFEKTVILAQEEPKEEKNTMILAEVGTWEEIESEVKEITPEPIVHTTTNSNIYKLKQPPKEWEEEWINETIHSFKQLGLNSSVSAYIYRAFDYCDIDCEINGKDFKYNNEFLEHYGEEYSLDLIKKACIGYINNIHTRKITNYDTWMSNFTKWCFENIKAPKIAYRESTEYDLYQKQMAEAQYECC